MDQSPAVKPQATGADLQKRVFMLGELFHLAWEQFIKNWQSIVLLTVVISLPLNLLTAIARNQATNVATDPTTFSSMFSLGSGVTAILFALLGILIPMGIAVIIRSSLEGKSMTFQEALSAAFGRWRAGVGTALLMVVCLIGLTLLLVIPAIYFGVLWAFAMYVVMDENLSGMAALKSSKATVSGRWWKVFGNSIAFGIVAGFVSSIVSLPFSNDSVISVAIVGTIGSIGTSFAYVGGYLLYRTLKANRVA